MTSYDARLDGKVAVVTGGSRGIGLAAAWGLGALGATVVLVGRDDRAATPSRRPRCRSGSAPWRPSTCSCAPPA